MAFHNLKALVDKPKQDQEIFLQMVMGGDLRRELIVMLSKSDTVQGLFSSITATAQEKGWFKKNSEHEKNFSANVANIMVMLIRGVTQQALFAESAEKSKTGFFLVDSLKIFQINEKKKE